MIFTHNELQTIRFALVIARLQMKTNGAIITAIEEPGTVAKLAGLESDFSELAQRILKATTQ